MQCQDVASTLMQRCINVMYPLGMIYKNVSKRFPLKYYLSCNLLCSLFVCLSVCLSVSLTFSLSLCLSVSLSALGLYPGCQPWSRGRAHNVHHTTVPGLLFLAGLNPVVVFWLSRLCLHPEPFMPRIFLYIYIVKAATNFDFIQNFDLIT